MSKAIVEIEMPESCDDCPLMKRSIQDLFRCFKVPEGRKHGFDVGYYTVNNQRHPDCPLKAVEE